MKASHVDMLIALGACCGLVDFAGTQPSMQATWDACPCGDWLAWLLGRLARGAAIGSPEHRRAVLIGCLCVRTVLPLISGDDRVCLENHMESLELWAEWNTNLDVRAVQEQVLAIRKRVWCSDVINVVYDVTDAANSVFYAANVVYQASE